jgi:hypothetical protein
VRRSCGVGIKIFGRMYGLVGTVGSVLNAAVVPQLLLCKVVSHVNKSNRYCPAVTTATVAYVNGCLSVVRGGSRLVCPGVRCMLR